MSSSSTRSSTRTRRGTGRRSSCSKAVLACGAEMGPAKVLDAETVYALGGTSVKCAQASCPEYTGIIVFLLVIYGFFCSCNWTFRPKFMQKANASETDANNLNVTASCLYALLWTALVLIAIALVVRCRKCVS